MEEDQTKEIGIDLGEFSKQELMAIIVECHERDCTIGEYIASVIEESIQQHDQLG